MGGGISHDMNPSYLERFYSLRIKTMMRHSEESAAADDEESLILLAIIQEGFLASLGMTA